MGHLQEVRCSKCSQGNCRCGAGHLGQLAAEQVPEVLSNPLLTTLQPSAGAQLGRCGCLTSPGHQTPALTDHRPCWEGLSPHSAWALPTLVTQQSAVQSEALLSLLASCCNSAASLYLHAACVRPPDEVAIALPANADAALTGFDQQAAA